MNLTSHPTFSHKARQAGSNTYISTRATQDTAPILFEQMVFSGLAPDGGLYMPSAWPVFTPSQLGEMRALSYPDLATRILAPFCVGGDLSAQDLSAVLNDCYTLERFGPDIAPLTQLDDQIHLLELFHGPTLAFKDFALQFLARIFDHLLTQKDRRITIIGATSGDTGAAAIAACSHMKRARLIILHPEGRISEFQRRQMTTVRAGNVTNIAIDGTFDDCQNLVKAMFNDTKMCADLNLTAINSINWLRIAAQAVYYFYAGLKLGHGVAPVSFTVPTGNFGNMMAAFSARVMGLDVGDLVIATNHNDILPRFLKTGVMSLQTAIPSLSPSMDIQIASNFERFLFELLHRDTGAINFLMDEFKLKKTFTLAPPDLARARALFAAVAVGDDDTLVTMRQVFEETGRMIDPHTAVAVAAARARLKTNPDKTPMVVVSTAHPAKFGDAAARAGLPIPPLPEPLKDLMSLPEHLTPIRNDLNIVKNFVKTQARMS